MHKLFRAGVPGLCLVLGLGAAAARAEGLKWDNSDPKNACAWKVAVVEMPDAASSNPEVDPTENDKPPLAIALVGKGLNNVLSEKNAVTVSARIKKGVVAEVTVQNNALPEKRKVLYFSLTPESNSVPKPFSATICCYGMGNGKVKLFLEKSTFPARIPVKDCIRLNDLGGKQMNGCITFKDPPR
jgi:hypothetical protein